MTRPTELLRLKIKRMISLLWDAPFNCQQVSYLFQILTRTFRIDKIDEESMEQSEYSLTDHGANNTQLPQQYMDHRMSPQPETNTGQSFDVALSKESAMDGTDEKSDGGRCSQGILGRNSQGGPPVRVSMGRPSYKMEENLVTLQDSLDKSNSIAEEVAKPKPGVEIFNQDTFGNSNPY